MAINCKNRKNKSESSTNSQLSNMLHVGDGYSGALAVHSMGEKQWGGLIHTQITWCFQSFDVFIAAHLLYSLVTSVFEGVCVGRCKLSIQYQAYI